MISDKVKKENEMKKTYLKSYKAAVKAVELIDDEIRQLRLDKMCPSVINDGMPHGSNCADLSTYAARLDELQIELMDYRYKRINLYAEIISKIENMSEETEKSVLRLKYIHGLSWEKVAVKMGYGWSRIHEIHSSALKNFPMD